MKNWVGDAKNRIFRKKNFVQVTENKSPYDDLNNVYGSIKFLTDSDCKPEPGTQNGQCLININTFVTWT